MWRFALFAVLMLGAQGKLETPAKLVCTPSTKHGPPPDAGAPPGSNPDRCALEPPQAPPRIAPASVVDEPAGLPLNLYTAP